MMFATDTVSLGDVRVSDGGYLEAFARTARTGVQQYLGVEMGRPDLGVVGVYRDAADVFSHASLHSFAKIPVTVDHPPAGVSAANWKQVAVGTTGEEVLRDGERLKIGLKIMDQAAIQAVQAGKRELSVGYRTEIVWGDGVAADGTPYQARQTNIVADHIAIVSAGRAGTQCRIGDSWAAIEAEGQRDLGRSHDQRIQPPAREAQMKTHMIGDNAVEMSDAAIVAVKGLQTENGRLTADNLKLTSDINTINGTWQKAIDAKDTEITDAKKATETKDGEIAALKQQLADAELTPAKLDAAVLARGKVVADARKVTGNDKLIVDGKTDAEIRREAVSARLGDAAKALSDEAVNGAFLSYANDAKPVLDHLGRSISASIPTPGAPITNDADAAYREMCSQYDNAWKRSTQGNA